MERIEERVDRAIRHVEPVRIGVVNQSSLDDREVADGIEILQAQIDEDFGPVWDIFAKLTLLPPKKDPERPGDNTDVWGLILIDSPKDVPQPNDPKGPESGHQLGYHDLTSAGKPLAKVFVNSGRQEGAGWVHTASHELLEMLADPELSEVAFDRRDAATLRLVAREVCDPVAKLGYAIDGRRVADFVYPAWYNSSIRVPERYRGKFHRSEEESPLAPFQLARDGYLAFFDFSTCAWRLLIMTAAGKLVVLDPGTAGDDDPTMVGSRSERRTTPRNRWATSDWEWAP